MSELTGGTVAAVSTPPGDGGIGVIRISGNNAVSVADACFRAFSGKRLSEVSGYTALYGRVFLGEEALDDAVALVFRAPHSFTGEDVVELSVHGGHLMVQSVLRAVLACGAAPAGRGEFSRRAYLNGKMDLAKAESIMGLISADNKSALKIARSAKSGRISTEISELTDSLTELNACLAAYADFPDEDIPGLSEEDFLRQLEAVNQRLERLLRNYDAGKVIREGISCVIVGKPNVGKSTLMNLLSGTERSIVTDIAGTTRDIIEETVNVAGITLRLADTAGIHRSDDTVEQVGIERAKRRVEDAELVIAVFDGSAGLDAEDTELLETLKGKTAIAVLNKSDRGLFDNNEYFENIPTVHMSAKAGDGLQCLEETVAEVTNAAGLDPNAAVLVSERQRDCAARALSLIREALSVMKEGCTLDAVSVCTDEALSALYELTGKRVTQEVADEVFRRFCIGK